MLLLAQGVLCLMIWLDEPAPQPVRAGEAAAGGPPPWTEAAVGVFAVLLAIVAAWIGAVGAARLQQTDAHYTSASLGTTLFSIALVMPMISTGTPAASAGRTWGPLTAHSGMVLLNLGLLLPAVILIAMTRAWLVRLGNPAAATQPAEAILFPRLVWRIDAAGLLVLSLLYVGIAQGRIRLNRAGRRAYRRLLRYLMYVLIWARIYGS